MHAGENNNRKCKKEKKKKVRVIQWQDSGQCLDIQLFSRKKNATSELFTMIQGKGRYFLSREMLSLAAAAAIAAVARNNSKLALPDDEWCLLVVRFTTVSSAMLSLLLQSAIHKGKMN